MFVFANFRFGFGLHELLILLNLRVLRQSFLLFKQLLVSNLGSTLEQVHAFNRHSVLVFVHFGDEIPFIRLAAICLLRRQLSL